MKTIERDNCPIDRDPYQIDRDRCQTDRDTCAIDRDRCQIDRSTCQIDRDFCRAAIPGAAGPRYCTRYSPKAPCVSASPPEQWPAAAKLGRFKFRTLNVHYIDQQGTSNWLPRTFMFVLINVEKMHWPKLICCCTVYTLSLWNPSRSHALQWPASGVAMPVAATSLFDSHGVPPAAFCGSAV